MDAPINPQAPAAPMSRTDKILCRIDKSMKVLEIGPSFSPLVPKADGWNSYAIDHDDDEGLRAKYINANVDLTRIEKVDFLWRGELLTDIMPHQHHGTFDACIASHVIEHLTNPIETLRSLQSVIKPDGVVSLAVPDKRYCFDYFKPLSMTGDLLYADACARRRHTRATAYTHLAYNVTHDGAIGWGQHPVNKFAFAHSLKDAKAIFDRVTEADDSPYEDFHGWYYTPSSFRLIILELNALGVLDWMEDTFFPSSGCEFYITLTRGKMHFASEEAMEAKRLELLLAMMQDLGEQCAYLAAGSAPAAAVPALDAASVRAASLQQLSQTAEAIAAQQSAVLQQLEKQGRQLRKIRKAVRVLNALSWPVRKAGQTGSDLYRRRDDVRRSLVERLRKLWP
jgi:SAM-dependent methyltransferase